MVVMFVLFIESKYNKSSELFSSYRCGELRENWLNVFEIWGSCVRNGTT